TTGVFLTRTTTRACGGRLALTLTMTLHRRSGAGKGHQRGGQRDRPLAGETYPGSGGKAVHGGIQGFHAHPRRLRLGHAEALEDVQGLPEKNPRGIGPPGAERRLRDPFEDLGLLVGVPDLSGQPEHGVVLVECIAVPAPCTAYVRDPAQGDDLLRLIPDLLG